jgi:transposase
VRNGVERSGRSLSNQAFDLGEDLFDRMEVGRVFGKKQEASAGRLNGFPHGFSFMGARRDRRARLDALKTGDGRRLPQHLKAQVCRELDRLELLLEQIKAVEAERDAQLNAEQTTVPAPPPMLLGVRGVGPEFASVLWSEGLSRHFDNRRQVAVYAGLAPTPWQSGSVNREQGI